MRAFGSAGGNPIFVKSAKGAYLTGADDETYVDFIASWGPMIVGHANPEVVEAVQAAVARGTSYGTPTELEVDMAEKLAELYPNMEMSRMVSSGTEATMGAIRLARGATKRDVIVKCVGAYHGGADYLLVKAGSGAATLGEPDSAGVPGSIAETTALIPFNDLGAVRTLFEARGHEIAGVIVEPVAGNMGCVPPAEGWLEGLRALCTEHGALLIFDEVMTGFRVALGGAQARYGVTPDITCLGKIVGGGLPAGAYGAPKELMSQVAPTGPIYQAGTLSGNPLAVTAGLKTIEILERDGVYDELERIGAEVESALVNAASSASVPIHVQRVGAMVTPFFRDAPVTGWGEAADVDRDAFVRWHGALIGNGVYWPPSPFEAAFPGLAHDEVALARASEAFEAAFSEVTSSKVTK